MTSTIAPPPQKKTPTVEGWPVGPDARQFPVHPLARLAYYARLAPSSHNTQPWKFVIGSVEEIDVFADLQRWLHVSDPEKRELFISVGCAIETLRIAADHAGWGSEVRYFPLENDESLVARVRIALAGPKRDDSAADLLPRVLTRRTSHRVFDPAVPVSEPDRRRLYTCFQVGDVSLHFMHERKALDVLAEVEARADASLFARQDYREELAHWVGEGMLGKSWLLAKLGQLAVGHLPLGERIRQFDTQRLASAPLVALLTTRGDARTDQVQCGEAYMRIALVAEAHGIRVQPMSQVLEAGGTRSEVAKIFGLHDRVAQHLFRLGFAPAEDEAHSRRPLKDILVGGVA